MKTKRKRWKPLTADQIEDRMQPCPDYADSMFWRQDEEARIIREHEAKKRSVKRRRKL